MTLHIRLYYVMISLVANVRGMLKLRPQLKVRHSASKNYRHYYLIISQLHAYEPLMYCMRDIMQPCFCNGVISQFNKVISRRPVILVAALERTDDHRIAVNLSYGDLLVSDIREGKMQNECNVDDNDVIYKDVVIIGEYGMSQFFILHDLIVL